MAIILTMPKLSDTMDEGGIAEWFKKEGDFVAEGDLLLAIETDKATMEYTSPEEGTLLKILAEVGQTVALQKPIAIFGEKGEKLDLPSLLGSKEPQKSADSKNADSKQPPETTNQSQATQNSQPSHQGSTELLKASPLAKKIAKAQGLDLTQIQGSGPHGRIVQRDLASAAKSSSEAPSSTGQESFGKDRADQRIAHTQLRKTLAKRLVAGKNEAPHFYLNASASMEAILQWREDLNSSATEKDSKVSINDLVILATAKALRLHPEVNSSWQADAILQYGEVAISMAVALPTGLITPILRRADSLGVRSIAKLSKELVQKAKDGKLAPEEFQGGSFTISNLGMTQVESFTAIINPPQAAILAVGRIQDQVVVKGDGTIGAQKRMQVTLSCDHRVIDGMVGARFLETLLRFLEKPLLMLS